MEFLALQETQLLNETRRERKQVFSVTEEDVTTGETQLVYRVLKCLHCP